MDVAEVESLLQFWGYAKDQHMAVFGLDLGTFQNSQAILFTQRTVVRLVIKLAMFGEHKAINGDVLSLDPLAIVLHFRPTIVGLN